MINAEPPYGVKIVRHVMIPTRDGTRLAADLYMPDAPGRFPVVLEYLPYRKDDRTLPRHNLQYAMAQRGYIGCRLDVRGTGSSEGIADDEYTETEQLDGYDAVQWLAEQPWSNGRVGMWGISYGGFNAVQVAMHRPPALKAIVPVMFTDDRYSEECHYAGGSPRALYTWQDYPLGMIAMNALPPHPDATDDWLDAWRTRLEQQPAWVMRWLREQLDGPYWRQGSLSEDYEAIECAVFAIGGWRDGYPKSPLRTFANIRAPKKVLVGPWTHMLPHEAFPGPQVDYMGEVMRFYDHWLKGEDNGVMDEAPVTVYVQEHQRPEPMPKMWRGHWRTETEWPLPEGQERQFRLGPENRLYESGQEAGSSNGAKTGSPDGVGLQGDRADEDGMDVFEYDPSAGTAAGIWCWVLPTDQRTDVATPLAYDTDALAEPLDIIGEPVVEVTFSATAPVAGLSAHLIDVAPDGTAVLVSKGYVNATRRDSLTEPEPLTPDERYPLRIELDCTAWRFRKGHRIRLAFAGTEWPNIWPTPYASQHTLHRGRSHTARLTLPEVPTTADEQMRTFATPQALPPLIAPDSGTPGEWRVERDNMRGEVSVYSRKQRRMQSLLWPTKLAHTTETTATVKRFDPSDVRIGGEVTYELEDTAQPVRSCVTADVRSTEKAFHVVIELKVTLGDQLFFQKRWDESIPRQLF